MTHDFRNRIEQRFEQLGHLIYRNHWKALLLVTLIIGSILSQLPNLTMDPSTESFLREGDNTLEIYNEFRSQFGRDEMIYIAIQSAEVFTQPFRKKLSALHHELKETLPYLDDITSLINARDTRGAEGELIVADLLEQWPEDDAALAALRARAMANPLYKDMMLSADGTITTIVIKTDAFSSVGVDTSTDIAAAFDEDPFADNDTAIEERPFLPDADNS